MAALVLVNAAITLNAIDLSDHGINARLDLKADDVDITAFNSGGNRARLAGLKSASLTLEFLQDFAASKVDATLWGIWNGGVAVACKVKAVNTGNTATNPEYQFNAILTAYSPLGNSVGDGAKASATFAIDGAVTRAVA